MKTAFVAQREDEIACLALDILEGKGCSTRKLAENETPMHASIGLFSIESSVRNRFIRLCKHRMGDEEIEIPAWGRELPFLVAVSTCEVRSNATGFAIALWEMARSYKRWGPWMMRPEAPWNPRWHRGAPHQAFGAWRYDAQKAVADTSCIERLSHRLEPIFAIPKDQEVERLVVTGCALFNKPHTDVSDTILPEKKRIILDSLELVVHEAGVADVQFVVPRSDLLRAELRDHFHPFVFMSLEDVGVHLGTKLGVSARLLGGEHMHARSTREIAEALERSGETLVKDVVAPLRERVGDRISAVAWNDYVGQYIPKAFELAQQYRSVAETIYRHRVCSRPSYASLHKLDPERGLRRTIANNVFYIAEAMYLKDNPDTAVVNYEFESAFWQRLEPVLEKEVWGKFRPFIGMAPIEARQPWSY